MEPPGNHPLSKYTISFGYSLAIASVVNGLLVIAKEKSPAVMSGMQNLTGHHWITHALLVLVMFALVGWLTAQATCGGQPATTANRLTGILVSGVGIGCALIFGFYLIGD